MIIHILLQIKYLSNTNDADDHINTEAVHKDILFPNLDRDRRHQNLTVCY